MTSSTFTSSSDSATRLTIRRPDDWHVHLRDAAMLQAVVAHTARQFARAIVMPNLRPPITTVAAASAYRERIGAALQASGGGAGAASSPDSVRAGGPGRLRRAGQRAEAGFRPCP